MTTENLSTLKIHKLTNEQYQRELGLGRIDPDAIYLTPDTSSGDGVSCTHQWDGTTLTVTSASGTSSADLKGADGDAGVRVSYDVPSDAGANIWINPNGQTGVEHTYEPHTIYSMVGMALREVLNNDAAKYSSIDNALNKTSPVADGNILGYTCGGTYNIMLLSDVQSTSTITINKDCILHLNGYELSFTKQGAYLNISSANVVINGEVPGSTIRKDNIVGQSGDYEYLVYATNSTLSINCGSYIMNGLTVTRHSVVITGDQASTIDIKGAHVQATNHEKTITCLASLNSLTSYGCTYEVSSKLDACCVSSSGMWAHLKNDEMRCHTTTATQVARGFHHITTLTYTGVGTRTTCVLDNCRIYSTTNNSQARLYGIEFSPVNYNNLTNVDAQLIQINNCYIDASSLSIDTYAIICGAGKWGHAEINGGYYCGYTGALNLTGASIINGGVYEGQIYGLGFMQQATFKIKNAICKSVKLYDGADNICAAIFYASNSKNPTTVQMDNCKIVAEANQVTHGIVAAYTYSTVSLSNITFVETDTNTFGQHLSIDNGSKIYVGRNVAYSRVGVYDSAKTLGTLDTSTYKDSTFNFDTEVSVSDAVLSVKDECGNWIGVCCRR